MKERRVVVSHDEAARIMEKFPFRLVLRKDSEGNPVEFYCAPSAAKVWGCEVVVKKLADGNYEITPAR